MGINGKMRVDSFSGEEAAGEESRLHGGLLQPGASPGSSVFR